LNTQQKRHDIVDGLAGILADLLMPFLARLPKGKNKEGKATGISDRLAESMALCLESIVAGGSSLRNNPNDTGESGDQPDLRSGLLPGVKKFLLENPELATEMQTILEKTGISFRDRGSERRCDLLGREDSTVEKLEMVYQMRAGRPLKEIARRFNVDLDYLYRLNDSFSLAGVAGILGQREVKKWLHGLDRNDPVLRRIEMIRLLRAGTPAQVIAEEYAAVEEYIERLDRKFSINGVIGILNDEDFERYRSLNPATIRICSYNLHGVSDDGQTRFRRIAGELADYDPHAAAFQEVVSGAGVEETSGQIARWISSMSGYYYRSQFSYCHQFMERYPEGVALLARYPLENITTIDLTRGLRNGVSPVLARNALACKMQVFGQTLILASVHLDHASDPVVRSAQVEKLVREIDLYAEKSAAYCSVLAGDFNDVEGSPAIKYLRSAGYQDAFRACHKTAGNTFPSSDPRSRIDYILIKGRATIVSSGLLLKDPELSDHIGVFAEVR
jgi:endonuclease/exonuclease/phosphatase family metal-dependent hydrolase